MPEKFARCSTSMPSAKGASLAIPMSAETVCDAALMFTEDGVRLSEVSCSGGAAPDCTFKVMSPAAPRNPCTAM